MQASAIETTSGTKGCIKCSLFSPVVVFSFIAIYYTIANIFQDVASGNYPIFCRGISLTYTLLYGRVCFEYHLYIFRTFSTRGNILHRSKQRLIKAVEYRYLQSTDKRWQYRLVTS